MKYRVIASLAVGLSLAACATAQQEMAEAGKEPLNEGEVRELMVGVTEQGVGPNGSKYMVYRIESGEIRGKAWGSWGQSKDTGTYTIAEDGLYCSEWKQWNDGRKRCWRVYEEGDDIVYAAVSGGAKDMEVRKADIVEGNPENL